MVRGSGLDFWEPPTIRTYSAVIFIFKIADKHNKSLPRSYLGRKVETRWPQPPPYCRLVLLYYKSLVSSQVAKILERWGGQSCCLPAAGDRRPKSRVARQTKPSAPRFAAKPRCARGACTDLSNSLLDNSWPARTDVSILNL